uniref:Uncharacterized protein n=2 Tax=Oryza punctata TaxID=4537 RepID=A0A1V1H7Q2_ORYPU|nr:hypothetical protein [Oryza punctata]
MADSVPPSQVPRGCAYVRLIDTSAAAAGVVHAYARSRQVRAASHGGGSDEMRTREALAAMDERQAMAMRFSWISELIAKIKKSIADNKAYILALIDAIDNDRCPYTAAPSSPRRSASSGRTGKPSSFPRMNRM